MSSQHNITMKRYILLITISVLIPFALSAQSLQKAQKQIDRYNYARAIEILKKAVEKEKTHNAALPMLAECYRLQHDILNSKSTYAQVIALPDAKPESYYYYAQALQSSGNYVKAREMFQKYHEINPSDPRGSLYASHCDSVLGSWKGKPHEYEVMFVNNINTSESDFGPAFYDGELIFASDFINTSGEGKKYGWTGRGYLDIMKARPLTDGDFWGGMGVSSIFDSKFNQEFHDGPAAFSYDGKSIYFTRSFYGKAKREGKYKTNLLKIYFAIKADTVWGEVKPFFLNSTEYSVGHPALSPDGQILYFVSDMPGGQGGTDIWMCIRKDDSWGPAQNLGATVNTGENEMFPGTNAIGELFFASNGHAGYGALDIFKTRNQNGTWLLPENMSAPINGSFDDFGIAFAPGEKNSFFSTNRPGGAGNDDIYSFRKIEQPVSLASIIGFVKDKTTLKPIAGATVFLYNTKTGIVKVLKTDAGGMYKTSIINPEDFIVKAMMGNYIADCTPHTAIEQKTSTNISSPRDLLLDKLVENKTFSIENIFYNFDKYNIREDAGPELDKLVKIMNENAITVELGSHTDCRGSFEYNDKLSQKRAESAVNYIINQGIDKNRITAKGYGERQLTNKCSDGIECSPEEHQANRRTEIKIISLTTTSANPVLFNPDQYSEGQELHYEMLSTDFFSQCK